MIKKIYILLVVFSFLINVIAKSSDDNLYCDDLSIHRDKYRDFVEAETLEKNVTIHAPSFIIKSVDDKSEALLTILHYRKETNLKRDKIDCYTVQVYAGSNRSIAFSILEKINNIFQDVYVQYIDSNYIVRVGKCINKLELCDKYVQMMKLFPNIIIRSIIVRKDEVFFRVADSDFQNDGIAVK